MARIKRRPRADGGTSYQVVWVLGGGRSGTGRDQAETFTSEARALQFKEGGRGCRAPVANRQERGALAKGRGLRHPAR